MSNKSVLKKISDRVYELDESLLCLDFQLWCDGELYVVATTEWVDEIIFRYDKESHEFMFEKDSTSFIVDDPYFDLGFIDAVHTILTCLNEEVKNIEEELLTTSVEE